MIRKIWADRAGTIYREIEEGLIVMELHGQRIVLGSGWRAEDFDNSDIYAAVDDDSESSP